MREILFTIYGAKNNITDALYVYRNGKLKEKYTCFKGCKYFMSLCCKTVHLMLTTHVEAGSNTSTVKLRVVRGDEMGLKKAAP
jgi:sarcosine oxidase delta subunit